MTRATKTIVLTIAALVLLWFGFGLLGIKVHEEPAPAPEVAGTVLSRCAHAGVSDLDALQRWVADNEKDCFRQFLERNDPLTLSREASAFLAMLLNGSNKPNPPSIITDDSIFVRVANAVVAAVHRWPDISVDYSSVEPRLRRAARLDDGEISSYAVNGLSDSPANDLAQFLGDSFPKAPPSTRIAIAVTLGTRCSNGDESARRVLMQLQGALAEWFKTQAAMTEKIRNLCPQRP